MSELFISPKSVKILTIAIPQRATGELYPERNGASQSDIIQIKIPESVRSVKTLALIFVPFFHHRGDVIFLLPWLCRVQDRQWQKNGEIVIYFRVESISCNIKVSCEDFYHSYGYNCSKEFGDDLNYGIGVNFFVGMLVYYEISFKIQKR